MRTLLLFLLLLAALGGGWYAWSQRPAAVAVVEVSRGDIAHIVYASGTVEARTSADVTSIVAQRIVWHCGCEGAPVEAGEVVVRLDDSETRARLRELQARVGLLEQQVERATNLLDRGVGSREEFDRATSELMGAEAAVAAQREVLARYRITAPIAGQILRLDAEVGEVAQPGDVLFTVGQPRPLLVTAEINEEDIPLLAVGQEALLRADAFPDMVMPATLTAITPRGDPALKTYRVRLSLPPDTGLFIGMSVDVNIIVESRMGRLLAPVTAFAGPGVVYVVQDGRAVRTSVETGLAGLTSTEIVSGLEDGARLVAPVPEGLADGDRIRPAPAGGEGAR